jgi:hypothetical protein
VRDFGSFDEIVVLISFVTKAPGSLEVPSCLKSSSEKKLGFGSGKLAAVATGYCSLNVIHLLIGFF